MTLRADHVAGAAFVAFGILVFVLSGELPLGRLSMPGAGFLPKLVAGLLVFFGLMLIVRGYESTPLASIDWSDLKHAASVLVVTAAAIALYTRLGFVITMALTLIVLIALVERQNILRASLYSAVVVAIAFGLFNKFLKAPLPAGPFGF
jgi:putative tricarboxylic transport membrane protein